MIIEELNESNFTELNFKNTKSVSTKINLFKRQLEDRRIDWYRFYDPTIWAFNSLKDKHNNPLILRGFQDKIINDKHRLIIVAAGNQLGKTWTACVKALHHAIFVPNGSVLIVSKSEAQAIMILDEIKWMIKRSGRSFKELIDDVENRTELHFKNIDKDNKQIGVSVIRCLPPTTSVLAYPATLIICDELAFWEIERMRQTEFFNKVILSRTLDTKNWRNHQFTMGQIFCISNTNGKQGIMWHLWNDSDYNQYRYCNLANPDNTLAEYQSAKLKYPSDEFDSVYAAVFSSASGGFITEHEYNDAVSLYPMVIPENMPLYLGGDFAGEDTQSRAIDESVLIGAVQEDNKLRVVYLKVFPPRTKKTTIYQEIATLKNVYKFAYDKVGVGDSVKNDLIERGILNETQIESLTYSLQNKSEVYYNLKHYFEQRKLILPEFHRLKEQTTNLHFEKTEGGHIKIHHASEKAHDDLADALANCVYLARLKAPVNLTIINQPIIKQVRQNKGEFMYCVKCDNYYWSNLGHNDCAVLPELISY